MLGKTELLKKYEDMKLLSQQLHTIQLLNSIVPTNEAADQESHYEENEFKAEIYDNSEMLKMRELAREASDRHKQLLMARNALKYARDQKQSTNSMITISNKSL